MMLADFNQIYPEAANLFLESGLDIESVKAIFGERDDWEFIESMLLGAEGIPPHSIPGETANWYYTKTGHEYWPSHLQLLSEKKGWDKSTIQSIDLASSRIMNHLFDPTEEGDISRHGLVIGHVQSGKTANYTAVMAKAADCGYNLFIVLTGLYNDLRDQTQLRLSKELVGSVVDPDGINIIGSDFTKEWKEETAVNFDFHDLDHPLPPNPEVPTLCVIKKNTSPLGTLDEDDAQGAGVLDWFRTFDEETLGKLNVLIIDDEADHASVNMMDREDIDYRGEPQLRPSKINILLRTLVNMIPRVAYVGYTATPFANVFIDPNEDDGYGPTLYPSDFITSLPRPEEHFGLEDIFPHGSDAEWPHVRIVPDDEAEILRAMTDDERIVIPNLTVPQSMLNAIYDYLIICGIRGVRGQSNQHSTMMIHTRHTINTMTPLVRRITAIIQHISRYLLMPRSERGRLMVEEFEERFVQEFSHSIREEWVNVLYQIRMQLHMDSPDVLEINMDSEDALDFDRFSDSGLKAIAVGGNRLSRGLTLEGLCVSFFVRPTTTHDTLMQMSRWFGYRRGFRDLVRIHVTHEIAERFSGMVEVERQLRDDLERYEEQSEITPLDFGVRVLQQSGMDPTRPGARRNVRTLRSGAMGGGQKTPYTESFHFDNPNLLRHNLGIFSNLISNLDQPERVGRNNKNSIWRNIASDQVINFLQELEYPEQNPWPITQIIDHIEHRVEHTENELSSWNLCLIGLQNGEIKQPLADFGNNIELVLPRRSRKVNLNGLGWFAGSTDTIVDLEGSPNDFQGMDGRFSYNQMWRVRDPSNPLILAYIFDKNSTFGGHQGRQTTSARTDLFRDGEEPVDLLGITVVLPRAILSDEERRENLRDYWIRIGIEPFPGL